MRSTFSRMFFPAAIVLLAALLLVGTSFRALTANYLEKDAMNRLKTNATAIAELALVSKAVTAGETKAIATVLSAEKRCESTNVKPTDEPASRPSPIDDIRSVLSESGSLETI